MNGYKISVVKTVTLEDRKENKPLQNFPKTSRPDVNRTRNPQLRRLMLYPIELRAQSETVKIVLSYCLLLANLLAI
jgi:hypothetical protein